MTRSVAARLVLSADSDGRSSLVGSTALGRKLDVALVVSCVVALAIEVAVHPGLLQRPLSMAMVLVVAGALAVRRSRPLAASSVAFGAAALATLVEGGGGPSSGAFVLIFPYALGRHGTRRDVAIGLAFMIVTYVVALGRGAMHGYGDAIGAAVVMLFPGAIGVALRFRAEAQARELEHAKLLERSQLARELHDSVAHHMMAITIQAQAARARPDAAPAALFAIEEESKRTLAELRSIVGALRDDGEAALVPAGRIADVAAFARDVGTALAVVVELDGDLEGVAPAVERAVYRIVQESITNAVKHARGATRIDVRVVGDAEVIRLTAKDDGEHPARRASGFGLVGMAERVALVGGTFEAGPGAGGWSIQAVLPRKGRAA